MPTAHALRLCPDAVCVRGRGERYAELSRGFMDILESVSPLVQPLSLDEAFVDVTGSRRLLGTGRAIAETVRARTLDELGLVVSVGVAPNKFVAKIASDLEKPDALVVFDRSGLSERLATLPVELMWGIGPRSLPRFQQAGLRTFGDLQEADPERLERLFGASARRFHELAHGRDDRPVVPERDAKSIGQERTFTEDIADRDAIEGILLGEVEQVSERLRRQGVLARSITLKIRFGDFETITRSRTLAAPTDRTALLWEEARDLFGVWADAAFQPVRLLGFTLGGFGTDAQQPLFTDPDDTRSARIDDVTDAIHARFGGRSISRARAVRRGRD